MDNNTQMQIGPALGIVIIIGVIAVAGIFFYKNMIKDLVYQEKGYTIENPGERFENISSLDEELSSSTDLDSIEADLNATVEADLSILDELDEQLLDFEDLEDFDFDI